MPRTALYDIEDVLTSAIDVLLEHSFHGAVMDEIIARTDFNRRGFYIEFKDKRHFLYRVLSHYQQTQLQPIQAQLLAKQGLVSIQSFFNDYINLIEGRGCLLINSITELGSDDETIKEMGRHYLDGLQIAFIGCLEHAAEHRQLKAGVDIESAALQLTCFVQGLAVNAVLTQDSEEMQIAIQSLLAPLLPEAT
ncbi:TetR/AcrR family transcriptional regulator [Alteromonas sediminis]|uniref:TetR/AcrR family transcriptional regulator n=1 Tax=Alteromonas sediminis TaxID=2259342 RepID=A0A3N5YKI7_9ALTE|nr:TetR family transcriptional regulator [Alteromonas sediminis]RPJ65461.1 TetR/AcrR family transcriptional regulator [Alteromonas sediminis]